MTNKKPPVGSSFESWLDEKGLRETVTAAPRRRTGGAVSGGDSASLIPFDRSRAPLLADWLARPHVAQWFPDRVARLEWALDPPPGGANALIACMGRPVGYLSWRKVTREALDAVGLHEIPAGSVDIDILIGEADCVGRGLGPKALALLVDRLRADPTVPLAGLTPSIDNFFAQRAYEKAGFRKLCEYEAPGFGRGVLMVMRLDRRNENSTLST